ncbi:MAG: hypothetical protein AAFO61_01390 [Pseudomonadota bacterium]
MSITDLAEQYEELTSLVNLAALVSGDSAVNAGTRQSKQDGAIAELLRLIVNTQPMSDAEKQKKEAILDTDRARQLLACG